MLSLRKLSPLFVLPVLISGSLLMAQISNIAPRISTQVDDAQRTRLSGNVPVLARAEYDRGEVASSTQLTHVRMVLQRSSQQEAALDKYLADLQDKSSPNYHKWLTPGQFGKLYGPADSDIAAIVAWLESHGLKVEEVSLGRTSIAFSGTASQVEEAFRTSIHSFEGNGRQFLSNTGNPSIPSALASVVSGVAHLNTIRPTPNNVPGPMGSHNPDTKRLTPVQGELAKVARPNLTLGSGTTNDPYFMYIVPGDAATIYDTPNTTLNANYTSGTTYDGTGVSIGIGGDAAILATTVASYRNVFLGNSTQPTIVNPDGVTDTSDTDEAYIDTELSGGLAPGATIYYYPSNDLTSGIVRAIDANKVDIFSLSFGLCELFFTSADNLATEQMWQQAAAQGIAVTVSTGDNGSATCDAVDPQFTTEAQYGLSVNGLASTPYNIAVGGTDMIGLSTSYGTYAGTSGTAAGDSTNLFRSAKSYIPESTWNDSTNADGLLSANTPIAGLDSNGNPLANIVAGGGGVSDCSVNTTTAVVSGTCTSGYPKPSWQRGTGVPSTNARYLPDVALMAGNGFDPATWLVCTDATGTVGSGVTVSANCTTQSDGNFYFLGFGGTSTAAPAFAGILAVVQQKAGGRLGQAAAELYDLYNGSHGSAIFHDITVGNNSVSCVPGSPNCVTNTASYPYLTGYNTTTGYDQVTGLGSVDANQLVTYWGTAVGAATATVSVTPAATSITGSQSLNVAVAVAGADGTPTGKVTLKSGSYTSAAGTLKNGAFTFAIPAGSLASGTDTLTVAYNGDPIYAAASGTATVTVLEPVVALSGTTLTFASTAVNTTDATTQQITVSNTGNGALHISGISIAGTNASSFSETTTCSTTTALAAGNSCNITVTFAPLAIGSLTGLVSIADDASGSPQTVALTGIGVEAGTYSILASAVTIASAGGTGTSTVTATGTGGYAGPNTITLTCSVAAITGGVHAPTCTGSAITLASGATSGTGSITLNTTAATTSAKRAGIASVLGGGKKLWVGTGGAVLACVLFFGIPARRRVWRSLLGLIAVVAVFGILSGCGGGGGGGGTTTNPGTTAGTYTVTVSASDSGSVKQTTTFTLTVQ